MRPIGERHIGALDGLRAAAILLVLLYHLTAGRESSLGLRALPFKLADIGWSGVDLFFVLSGFLITSKLLEARDREHRFRDFYLRRALRIFPLYYVTLTAVLLLLPMLSAVEMAPLQDQLPYWLYYSNFVQYPLPSDEAVPMNHFWSLAVEEQFYLVWPAVIFFCRRRTAIAICVAIPFVATALRYFLTVNGYEWPATYAWTPSRADGLALGSLLALIGTRVALPASVLALVATVPLYAFAAWRDRATLVVKSLVTPEAVFARTMLPLVASVMFAALLVLAVEFRPLGRVLSIAPFRAIARYSYGMYVFHVLMLPALQSMIVPRMERFSANTVAATVFVAGTVLSTALAAISYHAFESFFLRMKPRSA